MGFEEFCKIIHEIRNKCPWDKEQSHESLKKYLIEEAYEVLESIDEKNEAHFCEELGDLLLQVVLHAEIASERQAFSIKDVVENIAKKMIERHPHVFGGLENITDSKTVLENWEAMKQKKKVNSGLLSGVPKQLPALLRAQRLQAKSATVGFDWPSRADVIEKIFEEFQEFQIAKANEPLERQKEEFGDLLFAIVNLGRHFDFDVEDCLQKASDKYSRRFAYVESKFPDHNSMRNAGLAQQDSYWEEAKKLGIK